MRRFYNWCEEQIMVLKRLVWRIEDKLKSMWRKFSGKRK
jgi:hypothetical protein